VGRRRVRKHQRSTLDPARVLAALTITSLIGCQVIGGGPGRPTRDRSPEAPGAEFDPAEGEVYQGYLEMDGGRVQAALQLVRDGRRRVRGAFQGVSGVVADGEGVLRGETLSLLLTYGGDCPGRMELEGVWDRGAKVYEGRVEASDCTGSSSGTFSFSAT
jgi:hypothetical protein